MRWIPSVAKNYYYYGKLTRIENIHAAKCAVSLYEVVSLLRFLTDQETPLNTRSCHCLH